MAELKTDDSKGEDTQPSGKGQTGGGQKKKSGGGRKKQPKREPLVSLLTVTGTGLAMVNAYDGERVVANAEACADALLNAAKESDAVRRALLVMQETSAWGQVATAFLPVAVPIAANHGVVPAHTAVMVGAPPPPGTPPPADDDGQGDAAEAAGAAADLSAMRRAADSSPQPPPAADPGDG